MSGGDQAPKRGAPNDLIALMFTPEEAAEIRAAIRGMADNALRLDVLVNGDETASYTTTHGVEVPSVRRRFAELGL